MTPRQQAGLDAATAAFNATLDPAATPLTSQQYLDQRTGELLDSYADTHAVGQISPFAFTERFVKEGVFDAIVAAAATDANVAGLLAELRAKVDPVDLFSPKVSAGLGYLQSVKLITADQAARIGAA